MLSFFGIGSNSSDDPIKKAIDLYCNPDLSSAETEEHLQIVLAALNEGKPLLDLVRRMHSVLNHTDDSCRTRALILLGKACGVSVLSQQATDTVTEFLASRVHDFPCVATIVDVLTILIAGSTGQCLPGSKQLCQVVQALKDEVHPASHPTATRRKLFSLTENLLHHHGKLLLSTESSAECTGNWFVELLDGERDPRNLVIAFALHKKLVQLDSDPHKLGFLHSELFDVASCYFPITFTPPPNDPHAIKPEQLKDLLHGCLSEPVFSLFCVPFLLDKLTSVVTSTKLDVLDVIVLCGEKYCAENWAPHSSAVWRGLSNEILRSSTDNSDRPVLEATFTALSSVVKSLAPQNSGQMQVTFNVAKDRLLSLSQQIVTLAQASTTSGHSRAVSTILHYSAVPSRTACGSILSNVLPALRSTFIRAAALEQPLLAGAGSEKDKLSQPTVLQQRETISIMLVALLSAVREVINRKEEDLEDEELSLAGLSAQALAPAVDTIIECLVVKSSTTVERAALEGCGHLLALHTQRSIGAKLLQRTQAENLLTLVSNTYLHSQDPETRATALRNLGIAVGSGPFLVVDVVYKEWEAMLQNDPNMMVLDAEAVVPAERALMGLRTLATIDVAGENPFLTRLLSLLLAHVSLALAGNGSTHSNLFAEALADVALTAPESVIATMTTSLATDTDRIMQALWASGNTGNLADEDCPRISILAAAALQALFARLDVARQQHTIDIMLSPATFATELRIPQLLALSSLVAGMRGECVICSDSILPLANAFVRLARAQDTNETETHNEVLGTPPLWGALAMASLLNKTRDTVALAAVVEGPIASFVADTHNAEVALPQRIAAVITLAFCTKALAMRGEVQLSHTFADSLVRALEGSSDLRQTAADSFALVLPNRAPLTKGFHANQRILWDQRFFSTFLGKLLGDGTQSLSVYAFCAAAHLIRTARATVRLHHTEQVVPVLQRQLEEQAAAHLKDAENSSGRPHILATLSSLQAILASEEQPTPGLRVAALLQPLLTLATYPHSMRAREVSLAILHQLAGLHPQLVRAHREAVLKGIRPALDDKKRSVRRQAQAAVHKWHQLQ
eukprot:TRINITY_DN5003_c0_g1_i2.p1 TRINITY_DN5003_c0_g1~~TRINITY_DN5003_c0_g1_i2.p1  ORF type:complete len:1092 (+),score=170.62 TRINITY_DN5003_c0_g1_i2:24-3278(+)